MRNAVFLCALIGCTGEGPNGYLGEASGSLEIDGTERQFDGGALEMRGTDGDTLIVLTSDGWHFTCEWAEGAFGKNGGMNIDRQGTHWDLAWFDRAPEEAVLVESRQGLFGGGNASSRTLDAQMELDGEIAGTLTTDRGEISFAAHQCPGEFAL